MNKSVNPVVCTLIVLTIYANSCESKKKAPMTAGEFVEFLQNEAPKIENKEGWNKFLETFSNPRMNNDSVILMYYGKAESVQWAGDFNGWSQHEPKALGIRVEGSDIWFTSIHLPPDARVDYKIIVDGNWILDPDNELKQMAGVGGGSYNSELRMPAYVVDTIGNLRTDIRKGSLSNAYSLQSHSMDYELNYQVYVPHNYENLDNLPSLYVTDGHEYSRPELGNMITILDNLIEDKRIQPLLVVFVDPRNPDNLNENRRMSEYVLNVAFVEFFTDELIPEIDSKFKTSAFAADRGILGTSLGGLNSSYFHAAANNYFKRIGINSPAFFYKEEIFDIYDTLQAIPSRIIMTTGTMYDTQPAALRMKGIMEGKGYPLLYIEVNQGHSWGNWEELLDDALVYLYGN
jgi:enterochelin esterase family protein